MGRAEQASFWACVMLGTCIPVAETAFTETHSQLCLLLPAHLSPSAPPHPFPVLFFLLLVAMHSLLVLLLGVWLKSGIGASGWNCCIAFCPPPSSLGLGGLSWAYHLQTEPGKWQFHMGIVNLHNLPGSLHLLPCWEPAFRVLILGWGGNPDFFLAPFPCFLCPSHSLGVFSV